MKLQYLKFFKKNSSEVVPVELLRQWLGKPPSNSDLNHLIFDSFLTLDHVIRYTKKCKRQRFEKFRDAYFKSEVQRRLYPKQLIIQVESNMGYGVIAKEKILPNTYLGEYTGIVRSYIPSADKSNPYLVKYPVKLGIFKQLVIDAKKHGNHTRFYNHSSHPNAQLISVICNGVFRMIITSIKPIQNQSQILIDYGKLYWKQIGKYPNVF